MLKSIEWKTSKGVQFGFPGRYQREYAHADVAKLICCSVCGCLKRGTACHTHGHAMANVGCLINTVGNEVRIYWFPSAVPVEHSLSGNHTQTNYTKQDTVRVERINGGWDWVAWWYSKTECRRSVCSHRIYAVISAIWTLYLFLIKMKSGAVEFKMWNVRGVQCL